MEHDKEFDQEGLELTCLDLFKVSKTFLLIVAFLKLAIKWILWDHISQDVIQINILLWTLRPVLRLLQQRSCGEISLLKEIEDGKYQSDGRRRCFLSFSQFDILSDHDYVHLDNDGNRCFGYSEKRTKWHLRLIRCVLYLTRHPEVQSAAREEVEQVEIMVMVITVLEMVMVLVAVLWYLLWCWWPHQVTGEERPGVGHYLPYCQAVVQVDPL